MEDVSSSFTEQLRGLVSEDLPDDNVKENHSSDLEQICTYNFISKDDVWVTDDEDTVSSLLLKEIDFLTLPAVTALDSPHTLYTPIPATQPPTSTSSHPPDLPPLHPLPWPWGWEDSITPSPITTFPFCDSPANFDLLTYTENSVDSLTHRPDVTASRTEQFRELDGFTSHEHHWQLERPFSADPEQTKTTKQPFKQSSPEKTILSGFVARARESERYRDNDFPQTESGENFRRWYKTKIFEEHHEHESATKVNKVAESERSKELLHLHERENCKQFQETKTTTVKPQILDDASEEETRFTRIKKRPLQPDGKSGSEAEEYFSIDTEPPSQNVQKESKRDVNEPKRPQNGFIRYSVQHRAEMSRRHPYKDNRGISKLLGTRWKKMTREEKRPYEEEFNKDIHKIRTQHPMWRYAPVKKSNQDLAEPMVNRLRPRDKIRSKYQDLDDIDWNWELPKNTGDCSRHCEGSRSPLQHGATSWIQCDVCSLWRPLPGHVELKDLPEAWSCSMNPDKRFSVCGRVFSSLPVSYPSTERFPHFLQRPRPIRLQTSGPNDSLAHSPCVSLAPSQPSLWIVCSSIPSLSTPANSLAHAILVSQSAAVAL